MQQANLEGQRNQAGISVFYSYARKDEKLRARLETHLSLLRQQGIISEWHDGMIDPGKEREQEIIAHLKSASIILLLISPDFLNSDYHYKGEMERAMERHQRREACVIPIILRPLYWESAPFASLQVLPSNGIPVTSWNDEDEAFLDVALGIRRAITRQQERGLSPILPASLHGEYRKHVLKQVREIWIDGLSAELLQHRAAFELHLQERLDLQANLWRPYVQEMILAPKRFPDGTSIIRVYDEAIGELLILGKSGAGKTVLLLELTRILLERAQEDEQLPMPVVFQLPSWAEKRLLLGEWLLEELCTRYGVPAEIGQDWIETDQVLPMLDGLDKVPEEVRDACVQQINRYYLSHKRHRLVVCCGSEEYGALRTHSTLSRVVEILPLEDAQIFAYIDQVGGQGNVLRQWLQDDSTLRDFVRQPIIIDIFVRAYQGATAAARPTWNTREEMQNIIFEQYVERMLKRGEQSNRWKPEQVKRYLRFIAKLVQGRNQLMFSVDGLQEGLAIRYSIRERLFHFLSVVLTIALAFGRRVNQDIRQFVRHFVSRVVIAAFEGVGSLIGVLVGGLIEVLGGGVRIYIHAIEKMNWSWKETRRWFVCMVIGVIIGTAIGLPGGLVNGLIGGLIGELIGTLAGGLDIWSWKKAERWVVVRMAIGAVGCGLVGALVGGFVSAFVGVLVGALIGGLPISIGVEALRAPVRMHIGITRLRVVRELGSMVIGAIIGAVVVWVGGQIAEMVVGIVAVFIGALVGAAVGTLIGVLGRGLHIEGSGQISAGQDQPEHFFFWGRVPTATGYYIWESRVFQFFWTWEAIRLWVAGGVVTGTVVGGLSTREVVGTVAKLAGVLAGGLVGALVGALASRILVRGLIWYRNVAVQWVIGAVVIDAGLGVGAVCVRGQISGEAVGATFELIGALIGGLIGMLVMGEVSRLVSYFSKKQLPGALPLSPRKRILRSAEIGLHIGFLVGLIVGLVIWLVAGFYAGLAAGVVGGLIVALIVGLGVLAEYVILKCVFLLLDKLPWHLTLFLDEAVKRQLLRKVGGRYIFVHQLLLEYFATLKE